MVANREWQQKIPKRGDDDEREKKCFTRGSGNALAATTGGRGIEVGLSSVHETGGCRSKFMMEY